MNVKKLNALAYIKKEAAQIYFYTVTESGLKEILEEESLLQSYITNNHIEEIFDNIIKWLDQ